MPDDLMRIARTPTMAELAGRASDPRFYAALSILPNPDPILRRAGKSDDVFDAVQSDAHVIGELRAIKADFLRYALHLSPGDDSRAGKRALELCQALLDREPAPYTRWSDVLWSIGQSSFRGLSVQEVVWEKQDQYFVPAKILERPKRRFVFNADGELRLLTREQPAFGIPAERLYFLVDRHMPSYDNPYGVALFSSCFWPYTFKHAGFRWFIKFCERFGIPFPKGTYPQGSSEPSKKALEDALENLLEAGYAALEEGSDVQLMESKGSSAGKLAQHQLIDVCNAEMSKALSSQTLATETQGNSGSRAAAETHAGRAEQVNDGDRKRIAGTLDELWRLITLLNFGANVAAPTSHFDGDPDATRDRAEVYQIFEEMGGRASRKAAAEALAIDLADPQDPDDQFAPPAPVMPPAPSTFAAADTALTPATQIADQLSNVAQPAIDDWVAKLAAMASHANSLPELQTMFAAAYDDLSSTKLAQTLSVAFQAAQAAGRYDVTRDRHG